MITSGTGRDDQRLSPSVVTQSRPTAELPPLRERAREAGREDASSSPREQAGTRPLNLLALLRILMWRARLSLDDRNDLVG